MTLGTLLLDADYTSLYQFIAVVPCVLLGAVAWVFTAQYLKKRKPVFFVLFLFPATASVFYAISLVETRESFFRPLGVFLLVVVALLLGANVQKMFRK